GAALATLPMPWRARRQPWWGNAARDAAIQYVEAFQHLLKERHCDRPVEVPGLDADQTAMWRVEANSVVLRCYRNGPIEDRHAGMWSQGRERPGYLGLSPRKVARLERRVSDGIADSLFQRALFSPDPLWVASAAIAPRNWTLTAETSHVQFL